jgi:hypothetical protein
VETLLNVLCDLALLGSIALLLWGMVLCAMLEWGERNREPRGKRLTPLEEAARKTAGTTRGSEAWRRGQAA